MVRVQGSGFRVQGSGFPPAARASKVAASNDRPCRERIFVALILNFMTQPPYPSPLNPNNWGGERIFVELTSDRKRKASRKIAASNDRPCRERIFVELKTNLMTSDRKRKASRTGSN